MHMALAAIAIGTAANRQAFVVAFQRDFALVAGVTARRHQRMTGDAVLRRRGRGETQVQVAMLGGELAQGPDGDAVGQARLGQFMCPIIRDRGGFKAGSVLPPTRTATWRVFSPLDATITK